MHRHAKEAEMGLSSLANVTSLKEVLFTSPGDVFLQVSYKRRILITFLISDQFTKPICNQISITQVSDVFMCHRLASKDFTWENRTW